VSYDLQLRARRGSAWADAEVVALLAEAVALREISPGSWELALADGEGALFSLGTVPACGTVVDVSAALGLSDHAASRLYALCADLANRLDGQVYDPQADTSYSPSQLRRASASKWGAEEWLTLAEVACIALFVLGGIGWKVAGEPRELAWFGGALSLMAGWLILRGLRKSREKGEAAP
jgi:hypothetical protein